MSAGVAMVTVCPEWPGCTKEGVDCSPWGVRTDFPEEVIPEGGLKYENIRMQSLY